VARAIQRRQAQKSNAAVTRHAVDGLRGGGSVLTPLSVDGMIMAASTALLADSRSGGRVDCCRGRCW
jgi:hypothetical protein